MPKQAQLIRIILLMSPISLENNYGACSRVSTQLIWGTSLVCGALCESERSVAHMLVSVDGCLLGKVVHHCPSSQCAIPEFSEMLCKGTTLQQPRNRMDGATQRMGQIS